MDERLRLAQLRNVYGQVPVREARLARGGVPCEANEADGLLFELLPAQATPEPTPRPTADLMSLATCANIARREIRSSDLLATASACGPLFGLSEVEPLEAWVCAAMVAGTAVHIQEVVNGTMPPASLAGMGHLVKRRLTNPATGTAFSLVDLHCPTGVAYGAWFRGLPFIRRVADAGTYTYAFVTTEADEDGAPKCLDVTVVSLARELRFEDYLALARALELGDRQDADARDRLGFPSQDEASPTYGFSSGDPLVGIDAPIDNDDRSALAALVQALVAAHLWDARVDVFQASEQTGYLAFGSHLAWLWYDFSRQLDRARIGYCERCGRPFSLVGHRGIPRRFCSAACKTEAKNERAREKLERSRELFLGGASVAEIAAAVYPDDARGQGHVRTGLASWPRLRELLDESIAAQGWRDNELLARCRAEALDLNRLLPTRRRDELRRMAGERPGKDRHRQSHERSRGLDA